MGIKAIDYENLSEGDLITWYGMHVLRWEDEIRPYGIEPTIAFVQDNTQEILIGELLEALKDFYAFKTKGYDQNVEPYNKECPVCHSDKPYHDGLCPKYKVDQVIAKAEGGK